MSRMFADITNYNNNSDWLYLVIGAIVVDLLVIIMARYPGPYFKFGVLNEWYDRFGINAAIADITSALIGLAAARYIYGLAGLKGPLMFLLAMLLFQVFHDIFFYLAVILPLPAGENEMIDVFKAYAQENGAMILVADALILLASAGIGSFLKGLPVHYTASTGIVAIYSLMYILYTKRT